VVHAVHLTEALHRRGVPCHLFALGDPAAGFFRPVDAPWTIFPAAAPAGTLEERVFAAIDRLTDGLTARLGPFPLVHSQDCIAAGAVERARAAHRGMLHIRTVHHVDDFTTHALVECQNRSIHLPDRVLVVSHVWKRILAEDHGIEAAVVHNGVDVDRFAWRPPGEGVPGGRIPPGRFPLLTVGGLEPRKGSLELMEALALLKGMVATPPVLVVVGGHSFQDHRPYRDGVLARARELGLVEGDDFVVLGTVPDDELTSWFHAARGFVFPSVKEGWGLAVLEALAAGLPVVATDIPVFREYLTHDHNALLVPAGQPGPLARAMAAVISDAGLRERLRRTGPAVAARYTWDASAREHQGVYTAAIQALRWAAPNASESPNAKSAPDEAPIELSTRQAAPAPD
jgi:glycosyltransferase-like protein